MIDPKQLYEFLEKNGVDYFTGVPDSLLKPFLEYVQDHCLKEQHVIAANEGLAIGLAIGYQLSTGKLPLVYLQNSGLGNIINPVTSLTDPDIYSVPMLLMIGWRGRPGAKDEPQHKKMGKVTKPLLEALEIPCFELKEDQDDVFSEVKEAILLALEQQSPVAVLVKERLFSETKYPEPDRGSNLDRHTVIKELISWMNGDETVVCTTGYIGREFYELNLASNLKVPKYFLSVGGMGHANQVALGLHMQSNKKTIMLDGDGALLMHMGSLATIAHHAKGDFVHIVLNNGSHESVGGQPTGALNMDLSTIAKACGYSSVARINNREALDHWLKNGFNKPGLQFVEIVIDQGGSVPARPTESSLELKKQLITKLKESKRDS